MNTSSVNSLLSRFRHWLVSPADGHVFGLFRIIFGLFMAYYCLYLRRIHFVEKGLLAPRIQFKYDGLAFIERMPAPYMNAILLGMGICALLLALGLWMRFAGWFFALGLAYFFLQEKSYYNNHIYLFILMALLFTFTNADRFLSVGGNKGYGPWIPRWQLFIFQFQILIVYFFGGVAKLTYDWIFRQEPVRTLLYEHITPDHWLAPLLKNELAVYLWAYGGFAIDFFAPILLWYKPLRKYAFGFFVFFHLANSQIFSDISIFPFVMLGTMVLFFDTHEIPFLRRLAARRSATDVAPAAAGWKKASLFAYFAFQLLFPLRGFFLPNPLDYTTIGNRFSWRMKVDTRKPVEFNVLLTDPASGQSARVEVNKFINEMQMTCITMDPRALRDFARMIQRESARLNNRPNCKVKAAIKFSYNGGPVQYFVDPSVDLTQVDYSPFEELAWVIPPVRTSS